MTETTAGTAGLRSAVEAYWRAADTRDWDAFAATLAEDVVYDLPQTRERIRGKKRYLQFNRAEPLCAAVRRMGPGGPPNTRDRARYTAERKAGR